METCASQQLMVETNHQYSTCRGIDPIADETMGVYGGSTEFILRAKDHHFVEATGKPREANWFRLNLAIAIHRGNAFSILSADS